MRVVFLHGLESGPQGNKARWLAQHAVGVTPDLDTSVARGRLHEMIATAEATAEAVHAARQAAFATPLARAADAIAAHQPDVVVGSSFGGAVLLQLMHARIWTGPSVHLATAALKLTPHGHIPAAAKAAVVHGAHDDIIPADDAERLVQASSGAVRHVVVDDGHRLGRILDDGTLADALHWVLS